MGQASSTNQINNVTNSLTNVVNTAVQKCLSSVQAQQTNALTASGPGSTISNSQFNFGQSAIVDFSCLQSSDTKTAISNNMALTAQQQASATNSALSFTGTRANNVTNAITNLANQITNAYSATCANAINVNQTNTVTASDGGKINNVVLNANQAIQSVVNCVQNNQQVTDAKAQVQNAIGQTATTKVQWLTIGGAIALVVILILIGLGIWLYLRWRKKQTQQLKECAMQLNIPFPPPKAAAEVTACMASKKLGAKQSGGSSGGKQGLVGIAVNTLSGGKIR